MKTPSLSNEVIKFAHWPKEKRSLRRTHITMSSKASPDGPALYIEQNLDGGKIVKQQFMGGSSWSSAYVYETEGGNKYFVKTSRGRGTGMFEGEALGLAAMRDTQLGIPAEDRLKVPNVFHYGLLEGPGERGSFIVMDYLVFSGRASQAELGRRLACMHLAEPSDPEAKAGRFGFSVDNTIGGTPQPNAFSDSWIEFLRDKRLRHQLQLANDKKLTQLGDKLLSKLDVFFKGIEVRPSVLHGDLWSGNIAAVDGEPCIFDPATYYGHHEAEFGMSWCAGFTGDFWRAYHAVIPREPGWDARHEIYQLYHYLNHYNLFGGGYYSQCESTLMRLTRNL